MASGKRSGPSGIGNVLRAVRTIVRWRRRSRGPLLPTWDESFETWAMLLHQYGPRSAHLPLSWQRKAAAAVVPSTRPRGMRYEAVDAGGVHAEWFRPEGCDESRVLLYLHGGGYSIGSIDVHREPVSRMCIAAGVRGLVPEYRLAPEHPFPSQLEDAIASYRWLLETGLSPERIVIAGESAGGGLTISTLVSLRDAQVPLPAAAVCVSPWVDLEMRGETMNSNARYDYVSRQVLRDYARRFVGKHDLRNPLAAPVHADLRGLPPLLIMAGGAEVLLDDSRTLAGRARAAGLQVTFEIEPDMIHAWPLFGRAFARSQASIERIGDYARQALAVSRRGLETSDSGMRRVS
jgi:acetyl esterase/lipase